MRGWGWAGVLTLVFVFVFAYGRLWFAPPIGCRHWDPRVGALVQG